MARAKVLELLLSIRNRSDIDQIEALAQVNLEILEFVPDDFHDHVFQGYGLMSGIYYHNSIKSREKRRDALIREFSLLTIQHAEKPEGEIAALSKNIVRSLRYLSISDQRYLVRKLTLLAAEPRRA